MKSQMTRLLASVRAVEEVEPAIMGGADLLDVSHVAPGLQLDIVATIAGRRPICASAALDGVAYVQGLSVPGKGVGRVLAQEVNFANALASLKARQAVAAILDTGAGEGLFRVATPASVSAFVSSCRQAGLESWIAGHLEPPDMPRLLEYAPDVICMDEPANEEFRALIPREGDPQHDDDGPGGQPGDHVLVRDFILPVAIGAYGHERNRTQRVRFNVAAEVRRRTQIPRDMRDVFSYDLILDTIQALVAAGHTTLVETLAELTAQRILQHREVISVTVRVEKLDLGPEAVGVEIIRRRTDKNNQPP
jgi:dihydroneopterin aldolase